MENKLVRFIKLKKAAYTLAEERGFLKLGIKTYDMVLNLKERYISENIIRKTWDYHKSHCTSISDGEETRLIMQNCIYAGMLAAKFPDMDEDEFLSILEKNRITRIEDYVEDLLGFSGQESFTSSIVARGLVQDIYNDNDYLYDFSSAEDRWEYYKDFACVMFELGALYYNNR